MANNPSSEKRNRQNKKRNLRNRSAKSEIRTSLKGVLTAIEKKDQNGAKIAAKAAIRLLDKAVVHGILHKNNARRRISRIDQKIKSL